MLRYFRKSIAFWGSQASTVSRSGKNKHVEGDEYGALVEGY